MFSRILLKACQEELIHGVKLGKMRPAIDHLLFVDDIFLFYRANEIEARALKVVYHNTVIGLVKQLTFLNLEFISLKTLVVVREGLLKTFFV